MKFDSARECKLAFNYYKGYGYSNFVSIVVKSMVYYMGKFLESVDSLMLEEHPQIDVESMGLLLSYTLNEKNVDAYKKKLGTLKKNPIQSIWRQHPKVLFLFKSLDCMHILMHRSWDHIRIGVLIGKKINTIKYDMAAHIQPAAANISHQVSGEYCNSVIKRMNQQQSIFDWVFQQKLENNVISYMYPSFSMTCTHVKQVTHDAREFFSYRLIPEFYIFLYRSLSFVLEDIDVDQYESVLFESSDKVHSVRHVRGYLDRVQNHILQLKSLVRFEENHKYVKSCMKILELEFYDRVDYMKKILNIRRISCLSSDVRFAIENRCHSLDKLVRTNQYNRRYRIKARPVNVYTSYESIDHNNLELRSLPQMLMIQGLDAISSVRRTLCLVDSAVVLPEHDVHVSDRRGASLG